MWWRTWTSPPPPCVIDALTKRVEQGSLAIRLVTEAVKSGGRRLGESHYPGKIETTMDRVAARVWCRAFTSLSDARRQAGDEVLTFVPAYPPFLQHPASRVGTIKRCPHRTKRDAGRWILTRCATRSVRANEVPALCHPHNPVGRVFGRKELSAIAQDLLASWPSGMFAMKSIAI